MQIAEITKDYYTSNPINLALIIACIEIFCIVGIVDMLKF